MFLRRVKIRVGAAAALTAVLAMALAAPAGAAPWGDFELVSGFLPRVLAWLTPAPSPGILKCDIGATIDPNGCPGGAGKVLPPSGMRKCDIGSTIDPNGCPGASGILPPSGMGSMRSADGLRAAQRR